MPSSSLDLTTRKIISRWTASDFYCYLRPISSVYIDDSRKHTTYWSVQVEYRTASPQTWRGEGYDLDAVIAEMDKKIPKRSNLEPGYKPNKPAGYLAPRAVFEREVRAAGKKRKKKARARHSG